MNDNNTIAVLLLEIANLRKLLIETTASGQRVVHSLQRKATYEAKRDLTNWDCAVRNNVQYVKPFVDKI